MHPFIEYINPTLGDMLNSINMDKSFVRGKGCYLYDDKGNEYLDCIAAYGALPFGFNDDEIWQAILDYKNSMEPSFVQPSALDAAGELASKLISIVPKGLKYVTFTNSGAETVEASFKLCRSASKRMGILATKNSFHGKTLGALSATGKSTYQKAFGAPVNDFNFIKYGDLEELENELKSKPNYYAAFIVEPIQGEGGIVVPPKGYIKRALDICHKYGVFLILDEIQTGLGRTGSLFVCQDEGVTPDVLLLAKALSGGMIPIGACICTDEVYNDDFANKHSSTFASNSLACRVGIKAIEKLTRNDCEIIKKVKENGKYLKDKLLMLKDKYPDVIKEIRGRGYMLGIEFGITQKTYPKNLMGIMAEQEILTPIISSYLLNKQKIRVAPTLNGSDVIRIEPPLIMEKNQIDFMVKGIEDVIRVLNERNSAKLLSFLIDVDLDENKKVNRYNYQEVLPEENDARFAFLVHPIALENYSDFDESLSMFSDEQLKQLTDKWNNMVEPMVVGKTRIVSNSGDSAYGEFIFIPKTAEQFMDMPRNEVMDMLNKAVDIAKERGAKILGLGAYTSVVSGGGLYFKNPGIALTTGNSYTVVAAVDAVNEASKRLGMSPYNSVTAILGASGSIGRGCSILLSETASKLILLGNPQNKEISLNKLKNVASEIYMHLADLIKNKYAFGYDSIGYKLSLDKNFPLNGNKDDYKKYTVEHDYVIISTDTDNYLPMADVVIAATSSIGKLMTPKNLKYGAIVCDMSRPPNISEDVELIRPDVLVIDGGVIEVPGLPDLGVDLGFQKGIAYACMSETMMLALEKRYVNTSLGSTGISMENINMLRDLAKKHGFKLANFKSFNKELTDERWETIYRLRKQKEVG